MLNINIQKGLPEYSKSYLTPAKYLLDILFLCPITLLLVNILHETGHVIGAEIYGKQVTGIDLISMHPQTYFLEGNFVIILFGPMMTILWSLLFLSFDEWKAQFIAMGLSLSTMAYMLLDYGDAMAMAQFGYWWAPYLLAASGAIIFGLSSIKLFNKLKVNLKTINGQQANHSLSQYSEIQHVLH